MTEQSREPFNDFLTELSHCKGEIIRIKALLDNQTIQRQITIASIDSYLQTIEYVKTTIITISNSVIINCHKGIDVVLDFLRFAGMELNNAAEELDYRKRRTQKFLQHLFNSRYYLDEALKAW